MSTLEQALILEVTAVRSHYASVVALSSQEEARLQGVRARIALFANTFAPHYRPLPRERWSGAVEACRWRAPPVACVWSRVPGAQPFQ
jgi:hypothetical protein